MNSVVAYLGFQIIVKLLGSPGWWTIPGDPLVAWEYDIDKYPM